MCFNRILDVNNTEDPDADGAPPLETAVRHERPRACKCAPASASVPLVIVCTAKAGRSVKVMPHVVASAFADVITHRDAQGWQGWYAVPVPSVSFGNASSVPLDAAQTVRDAFQRPSGPGHREEREPLVDEDIGVHVRRDEVHARDDPVLLAGRRDGVQAGLIGGAGVLQRYAQLDGEVRRAD